MKEKYESEFRIGPRTVLTRGDKFRAMAGPYFENGRKVKVPMIERGPFTFIEVIRRGKQRAWIKAINRGGGFCLLWIGPREKSKELTGLTNRPYRITGKVRSK